MNMLKGLVFFVLGLAVVGGGIVAYQLWINPATKANTTSSTDARNQFLADRGGGAATNPITGTNGATGQGGFPGGGFPGVFGTVQSVGSDSITVQTVQTGTVTVHLATTATISMQVSATAADIKVGEPLVAIGAESGTVITATRLQLGSTDMGFGFGGAGFGGRGPNARGTPGTGRPGFTGTPGTGRQGFTGTPGTGRGRFNGTPGAVPQGTPGAGFNGQGFPGGGQGFRPVTGTVKSVDGSTVTVTEANGTTVTVLVAATTQLVRQETITLPDVKAGDTVRAIGTQSGAVFEATALFVGGTLPGGAPPGGAQPNGTQP